MLRIDENLLKELGLATLPAEEQNQMLGQIYETLEIRVGMTLAKQMSEEQLKEFESFVDSNDESGALKWLETNFPDYKKVVHDELAKLKDEIKQNAAQILQEMQQARAAAPADPAAQPADGQAAQQADPAQPAADDKSQPDQQQA